MKRFVLIGLVLASSLVFAGKYPGRHWPHNPNNPNHLPQHFPPYDTSFVDDDLMEKGPALDGDDLDDDDGDYE